MQETAMQEKKVVYSAVQPSGNLTIGNYVGSIRNWIDMQDDYTCYFAIANMHAITVKQDPALLRRHTLELAALYIACGLDPEKCALYVQSMVPQHAELCWALNTVTYVGEMQRMTQFKDKSAKHADNINMGLMDYPVLMAADILCSILPTTSPSAPIRRSTSEIARDIAIRFNNRYGETFRVPQALIVQAGRQDHVAPGAHEEDEQVGRERQCERLSFGRQGYRHPQSSGAPSPTATPASSPPKKSRGSPTFSPSTAPSAAARSKRRREEFEGKGYGDFKLAVGETVADAHRARAGRTEAPARRLRPTSTAVLKEGRRPRLQRRRRQYAQSKVYRKVGFYQGE